MSTQCTSTQLEFPEVGRRRLVASFDGGTITSNAGALLLRAVEKCTDVCRRASQCFQDYRDPDLIEHTVEDLVTQRVMAVALGYEDLNDHDTLRRDPLVAAAVGKADPTGENRVRPADRGAALAGKSTLNRLELVGSTTTSWGSGVGHRQTRASLDGVRGAGVKAVSPAKAGAERSDAP